MTHDRWCEVLRAAPDDHGIRMESADGYVIMFIYPPGEPSVPIILKAPPVMPSAWLDGWCV